MLELGESSRGVSLIVDIMLTYTVISLPILIVRFVNLKFFEKDIQNPPVLYRTKWVVAVIRL